MYNKTIRIYEQADKSDNNVIYSWILDAPYKYRKYLPQWKWLRGKPSGCYVTNNPQLAKDTAQKLNLTIQSNGTHQIHKVELYREPSTI